MRQDFRFFGDGGLGGEGGVGTKPEEERGGEEAGLGEDKDGGETEAARATPIRMEAFAKDEVDAVPRHEDRLEAKNGAERNSEATPPTRQAAMEDSQVA